MSKEHKYEDLDAYDGSKSANLLNKKLLEKLVNETVQSTTNTGNDITRIVHSAMQARRDLIRDELPATLSEDDRKAILAEFTTRQAQQLTCSLMKLTVTSSLIAGDALPIFIGHAAKHWEDALLEKFTLPLKELYAERIQEAAAASTGKHN
jgi:hypothetical protein